MADDTRDYLPQHVLEEDAPTAKENGLAAFRTRVGRIALPSVLVLAVSAGLAFSAAAPNASPSGSLTAVPAAPVVHVERNAQDISRAMERAPFTEPGATPEEALPVEAAEQSAEEPAEAQALSVVSFAPSPAPVAKATDSRYATAPLNVRSAANAGSDKIGSFDRGDRVSVTDHSDSGFRQVELDGRNGWVSSEYLAKSAPSAPSTSAPSSTGGSSQATPSTQAAPSGGNACKAALPGLTSRTTAVHQALCANFPAISSYGGVRSDGDVEHPSGRAIDAMISSMSTGQQVADWARANAGTYGITEVIWNKTIWTTQRGGEGWRGMSDRGSATANHMDHVHISVG